jgi:hypothetical protein
MISYTISIIIGGSRVGTRSPGPLFELSYRPVKRCFNRIFPISSLSFFLFTMFCNYRFELHLGVLIFLQTSCFEIRLFFSIKNRPLFFLFQNSIKTKIVETDKIDTSNIHIWPLMVIPTKYSFLGMFYSKRFINWYH